jgi:hypothetical protein
VRRVVTFYATVSGNCPINEFLDSLPAKAAQKVTWVLGLLEDLDIVPSSYFKKLSALKRYGSAGFNPVQIHIVYSVSL